MTNGVVVNIIDIANPVFPSIHKNNLPIRYHLKNIYLHDEIYWGFLVFKTMKQLKQSIQIFFCEVVSNAVGNRYCSSAVLYLLHLFEVRHDETVIYYSYTNYFLYILLYFYISGNICTIILFIFCGIS